MFFNTLTDLAILKILEKHRTSIRDFFFDKTKIEVSPNEFQELMMKLECNYTSCPSDLNNHIFSTIINYLTIISWLSKNPLTNNKITEKAGKFEKAGVKSRVICRLKAMQELLEDDKTTYEALIQPELLDEFNTPQNKLQIEFLRFFLALLMFGFSPNITTLLGEIDPRRTHHHDFSIEYKRKKLFFMNFLFALDISNMPMEIQNETLCVTFREGQNSITINKELVLKFEFYEEDFPLFWGSRKKLLVEFMLKYGKIVLLHWQFFDDINIPLPPSNMTMNQTEDLYNLILPQAQRQKGEAYVFRNQVETYAAILTRDTSALFCSAEKNSALSILADFVRTKLAENLNISFEDLLESLKTTPEARTFTPDEFSAICRTIQAWLVQFQHNRQTLTRAITSALQSFTYFSFKASLLVNKTCKVYFKILDSFNIANNIWLNYFISLRYQDLLDIYQVKESRQYFFAILKKILADNSIPKENLKFLLHKLVKKPTQEERRKEKFTEDNVDALETALVDSDDTELHTLLIERSRQAPRTKCDLSQKVSAESFANNPNRVIFLRTQPPITTKRTAEQSVDDLHLESQPTCQNNFR